MHVEQEGNLYLENYFYFVLLSFKCSLYDVIPTKSCKQEDDNHKWYFITKILLTYCDKKSSSDQEKLLKFEAEGQ